MEWIADPSIWAGLITLIVIELVLGIDNLVFIAILAEAARPRTGYRAAAGDVNAPVTAGVNLLAGHPDSTAVQLPLVYL